MYHLALVSVVKSSQGFPTFEPGLYRVLLYLVQAQRVGPGFRDQAHARSSSNVTIEHSVQHKPLMKLLWTEIIRSLFVDPETFIS